MYSIRKLFFIPKAFLDSEESSELLNYEDILSWLGCIFMNSEYTITYRWLSRMILYEIYFHSFYLIVIVSGSRIDAINTQFLWIRCFPTVSNKKEVSAE